MAPNKRKSASQLGSTASRDSLQVDLAVNGKKRKLEADQAKEDLIEFITEYNLAVNEYYQLQTYGSIVEWRPKDFASYNKEKPDLFEHFIKENNIGLTWLDSDEDNNNLDDLPLRLQKKVLAEREAKCLELYPFKDEVIDASAIQEQGIIQELDGNFQPVIKKEVKPTSRPVSKKAANSKIKSEPMYDVDVSDVQEAFDDIDGSDFEIKQEEENFTEVEYPSDLESVNTHYKLKDVKFTIPGPKITHPSHIPGWSPPKDDNLQDDESQKVIQFDATPIEFISTKKKLFVAPQVENKLRDFLDNKFKAAIIDEAVNPDFNHTVEEADAILEQQKQLFKSIKYKITEENSLELNGDKIEKRKLTLPQTNARLLSDPFRDTSSIIPKAQGPSNSTHIDNLLSQGASFARIHQQVRKQHQLRAKKIATMVDQHFKWKRGERARLEREREQNLKKISRLAMQAVKKRWGQAHRVYKILQDQKEEELKKIRGREHLSHMLEHSTQLLEAQLNRSSRDGTPEVEDGEDENSDNSSSDSENLSTSGSDESDASVDDTMDDTLPIEKLKEKYGTLEDENGEVTNASSVSSDNEDDISSDSSDDGVAGSGLAALYGGADNVSSETPDPEKALDYTDEQLSLINKLNAETEGDKALDSSDSDSIPDETSESENESSVSLDDEEESTKETGLSSLISNGNAEKDSESNDDSVEESGLNENSDDENMSVTELEDEPKTPRPDEFKKKEATLKEEVVNGSTVRDVPVPSLLRGTLRPYQKQGLNWLASLYSNDTNGILADEMGLGKTIQTISLLAHLATEYHIWGPHLIIVPTSVMLNWEMEFKKFAPGFKVLTYYGSPQQRAQKRKGWNKPNAFHVCITSYQLVVHDHQSFKRRKWRYMILDEAHNIKNFRSNRWKALLNFNTENRLLLTGTPLQNNLIELWSLLYFLMPSSKVNQAMPDGFANLEDFQTWFGKPVDNILERVSHATDDVIDENESTVKGMDEETKNTVARLHQVLRPYILRRLKKDVEKQMPGKYEHIVYCRLSKRQRFLYDDFMSRAKTKETLTSGNFLSIINCLMQLRKVCNHPDLFEIRPIVTSLALPSSVPSDYSVVNSFIKKHCVSTNLFNEISFDVLNLDLTSRENLNYFVSQATSELRSTGSIRAQITELDTLISQALSKDTENSLLNYYTDVKKQEQISLKEKLEQAVYLNDLRCEREPIYGESLVRFLKTATDRKRPEGTLLDEMIVPLDKRAELMKSDLQNYAVITPKAVSLDLKDQYFPDNIKYSVMGEVADNKIENPLHLAQVKLSIAFPDKQLLQYDCGKLQVLDKLLQRLTSEGHRALIFTQMTKVLDILEQFLNIHGYRYMRLDGATKIEDRQLMTEKFNRDPKIPVFILSSRSGGLGINLTGADTVIFYDSDWNPAMDKQCQDRCHRIGQVRDVHIYRFVSEHTIESNILKKANQKRQLDNVVIQEGDFTTDYFGKFSVRDLVNDANVVADLPDKPLADGNIENVLMQAEDEDDRKAATAAMKETAVDDEDFNEDAAAPGRPMEAGGDDQDYEEGVGHIDEYMLRYIANGYYD